MAVTAATIISAAPAPAGGKPGTDPDLVAAMARFDAAQVNIHAISAHFEEVKTIALLKDPVVQSGEFYHTKPDKFLWEYTKPEPKLLMLNGEGIMAYYPSQKRAEEIKTRFGKRIVKYLALGSVMKDLADEYDMTLSRENSVAGTDLIVMKPRGKRIQKRLAEIRIWLDRELNQPREMAYLEADGDRTHYKFDRIAINPQISVTKYQIKLPEGVTVTNSLAFFGGGSGR